MDLYDLERLFEVRDEPRVPHADPSGTLPTDSHGGPADENANEKPEIAVHDNLRDDQTPPLLGTLHSQLVGLDELRNNLSSQQAAIFLAEYHASLVGRDGPEDEDDGEKAQLLDQHKKIRRELDVMRSKVDQIYDTMRRLVNRESRPGVRKLHLLDLPEEVLRQICGYFGPEYGPRSLWFFPDFRPDMGRNIINIRLTCRRLYEASSHLLLTEALVLLEPASISETQIVSSHPFISKGVQRLNVNLGFYRADFAASLAAFAQKVLSDFDETMDFQARMIEPGRWDERFSTCSRRELARAIKKGGRLHDEWTSLIAALHNFEAGSAEMQTFVEQAILEGSKALAGMVRAHERYKEHYKSQESLLRDDTLVHIISDILQKMPTATRLHIGAGSRLSHQFEKWEQWKIPLMKPFQQWVDDPYSIARYWGVQRSSWRGTEASLNQDLPAETCLEIITRVLVNSKLSINHLSLELPISSLLEFATEERLQVLRNGARRMRIFEYTNCSDLTTSDDTRIFRDTDWMRKTTDLLLACMGGPCLRRLSLSPSCPDPDTGRPEIGMGRLLSQTRFPELEYVSLHGFYLHLHELKTFTESLVKDKVYFHFNHVTLLSGTWAEAIHLLRAKSGYDSSMEDLHGAECDDLTEEEREALFPDSFSVRVARDRRGDGEAVGRPAWERTRERHIIPVDLYIQLPMDYGFDVIENPFEVRAAYLATMGAAS